MEANIFYKYLHLYKTRQYIHNNKKLMYIINILQGKMHKSCFHYSRSDRTQQRIERKLKYLYMKCKHTYYSYKVYTNLLNLNNIQVYNSSKLLKYIMSKMIVKLNMFDIFLLQLLNSIQLGKLSRS